MVTFRQSQGWPTAALMLSGLFLFAGCEEFTASNPNAGPPETGTAEAKPATSDAATGTDTGETVDLTVYMDGEAIDTITVPKSLAETVSASSSDITREAEVEDSASTEIAAATDDAEDDQVEADPPAETVAAEIAATSDAEVDEKPAIPEILLERERAITAQMELNAEVDQNMDWLSEVLGQQTEQMPPLSPPAAAVADLPALTREEGIVQMELAIALAESGDLKGALDQLALSRVDPYVTDYEFNMEWAQLQLELAALYFDSLNVSPVAARMTATVLRDHDPASTVRVIREDLRRDWAWAWRYEGRTRVLEAMFSLTPDTEGLLPDSLLAIEGYSNVGLPVDLLSTDRPLEHYHFAVYLMDLEYLLSYSLQSRELAGTGRIYFLERRVGDSPEVLLVYPYLPDYWSMLNEVKLHLEQTQQ